MNTDKHKIGLLLSQVALRDQAAFEALYQLTRTRLFNVILGVVKDEHVAADVLQEGFVKLWHNNQQYPVNHPWAWLCQSMRNLAIDEIRKRNNRGEEQLVKPPEEVALEVTSDSGANLSYCLNSLAEEKRNAIILAYQHGMSHQEIVHHVSTPLGTVKSWIRRGLQELKRCLTN
ncbi:RNA polymerase sigma factor [Vibrio campbellii]|uniref:RNA polymerase sigma factor n=1 Tax=Vibrio campbellii TaxID=680 RepID=UPI000CD34F2A|nr:sigma-70 family RNA polymerase sigma factor [Vibrio campbellii]AUV87562.1 RNA polymerase subunit sigma [Vibrio campbellii]